VDKYIKRFKEWLLFKESLDARKHAPPLFSEGDIWWCHIGENVGIETGGKGNSFTRPILIFKKYDRYSFLSFPLTTRNKTGTWYAPIRFRETIQSIIVAQGRTMDYRRLKERIGELDSDQMKIVRKAFLSLHS
jgi:mRNA interferase MazF